jgi:hypothetical protein
MSLRVVLCLFVALLLAPVEGRSQEVLPVPVYVFQRETLRLPPLKPEQHEAEITRTRAEMFEVAERLRKEHGNKTNAWPPEVWKVFYEAEDAHELAVARRDYEAPETTLGLADSIEDFVRGVSGSKAMTMVTSPDEASLVVQITARRWIPRQDPLENGYFIRFRLSPGAKMTGERFLEATRYYKWKDQFSKVIVHPKDTAGYFEFEAGSPVSYKNCAGTVRAIVERFIRARLGPAKKK